MKVRFVVSMFFLLSLQLGIFGQEHWPGFRGPGSRGVGEGYHYPETWGPKTNIVWKVKVPGRGWSSPIVWGNNVFVTTAVSEGEEEAPKKGLYFGGERPAPSGNVHRWKLICFDFVSGEKRWETTLHEAAPTSTIHVKNTYSSETPVTDGCHVYVYYGHLGLFCVDFDGNLVWSKTWQPHPTRLGWGSSASPVLFGDRVLTVNDNEGQSYLAAYQKLTGKELWRVERDEPTNFSTPFVWENEERTEIVTTGVKKNRAYSADGKLLWEMKGMSSIVIPTPFAYRGMLYLAAGYVGDNWKPNKPVYVLKSGGNGNLDREEGKVDGLVWMEENASSYNPSPMVYQDRFYVLWDFGFFSCRDALTGREIYEKQRFLENGRVGFTASPWAYGDRIFCLSEDGDTYVVEAGDTFRVVRVNALEEMCMATPAMARGAVFIRGMNHLFKIEDQGAKF